MSGKFCLNLLISQQRKMSKNAIEIPVQTQKLLKLTKSMLVPKLNDDWHKGQYGRVGVIGGSLEYTGAPYFSALTALKVGADLSHVFCAKDAASVIKSYSPDLIVHPLLDAENAVQQIEPWLERLHVLVLGPGLGRNAQIQETAKLLLQLCLNNNKPLVIDADGLFLLNDNIDLIAGRRNVILTPNVIEFQRLFGNDANKVRQRMQCLGDGIIVLEKAACDKIHIPSTGEVFVMPAGGSARRCGGQGDLLCGSLAIFFYWSLQSNQSNPAFLAAFAASYLVKQLNASAFRKHGRSMLASDMITEISPVFREIFENSIE